MKYNAVTWFDIYVQDMTRAKAFYEAVFLKQLEKITIDDSCEMWVFPSQHDDAPGASGALIKMQGADSGAGGTMVYFNCDDCAVEEKRALENGGQVCQTKLSIGDGEHGFFSIISDTEGNVIGLHSLR